MRHNLTAEELAEHFTLSPNDLALLANKACSGRLGFAVMLKVFERDLRFPDERSEVPTAVVSHIAKQIDSDIKSYSSYDLSSRNASYHRAQIRRTLGFRKPRAADANAVAVWLSSQIVGSDISLAKAIVRVYEHFRHLKIVPPTTKRIERIARSAIHLAEERYFATIAIKLSTKNKAALDALLISKAQTVSLTELKADPGKAGLKNAIYEIDKLTLLTGITLPDELFTGVSRKFIGRHKHRISVESIHETARHSDRVRHALLASFCFLRRQEITDNLVDLLIQIIHGIRARSKKKVEKEMLNDLRKVSGKTNILCQLAETAITNPDSIIREAIYPIVSERILNILVKELKASGQASFRAKVQTVMRASYGHHYRLMIPQLLRVLEFRSNNDIHRPMIDGLGLLQRYAEKHAPYFVAGEEVPIKGVVQKEWRELIVETCADGKKRINRINYELALLKTLRDKLRCKEIWVVGADRFRNPDEDLPLDFDEKRVEYYDALGLPRNPIRLTSKLREMMSQALDGLDCSLSSNQKVRILAKEGGSISVTPLDEQPEPQNLGRLKAELLRRWPMTSLLDVLKETDLRVSFFERFKSSADRETLSPETLRRRLLLAIYGLGTNTGLKRIVATTPSENYQDVVYVRRRFIHRDALRPAIADVCNATLEARLPHIWGEATTACASDSKKFGSWDQNLMTEWHVRYGGRGIMIYWHVDKKSLCIYSQTKSCSSSEVAAMIEGVLRHCTEMKVEKNYVDSHGQSEVAFAFCHLLGFELMPRLKIIHTQKLHRPCAGNSDNYKNLRSILARPINWELIVEQYDQMVKFATALRLGTADTEAILRRFTRNNLRHPTYQAFSELGKAVKTIFLCRYLSSEAVRREIHEGLNVVENWNSANSFIFYGKGGEVATNRVEDQETSLLSLHLLQTSLVYINTLMLQGILAEQSWLNTMGESERRALSPLIYAHVNPYGTFKLDMKERIALDTAA